MDKKRGAISFVFIIIFIIFLTGLVSSDHCWVQDYPCDGGEDYTVMHLSSLTNAHGELWDQHAYDSNWHVCCTFSGTHTCDGNNVVLKLSRPTNAHAQIPSLDTYNYDVCYGNLDCVSTTSTTEFCPVDHSIFMVYLANSVPSGTNLHIAGSEDGETAAFLTGYGTRICCAPNISSSCGNGVLDLGEGCDDGNHYNGDGCSWPECQVESGCVCNTDTPNCCYCTPTSHWYLNSNPTQLNPSPNYYGLRVNDILTMRFDTTFCMSQGSTRTFQIREGATTIATATATVGATYTQATYGPIQQSFLNTLGIGHSQILFRMLSPYESVYHNSYTIEVVPKFCGDTECSTVDGENCANCPGDCGECCGNTIIDVFNGETCDDGNKISGDGCSYPGCTTETPTTCELTSKSWSTSNALGGETVQLIVYGNSNCNGQSVTFNIYEYDLLGDDDPSINNANPLAVTMIGGQATTSWVAEWPDVENEQNPEYYFVPSVGSVSLTAKTPRLSVSESDPCGNGIPDPGETCSNCEEDIGKCCGNGIIDSGEQCDSGNLNGRDCDDVLSGSTGTLACYASGTTNECQFNTIGCSIPDTCNINTASWNETEVNEGTWVALNVLTNNCNNGEIISFVIKESDGFLNPDDDVINNPQNAIVTGNSATGLWRAEWQDDRDGSQSNPPEYYFTATILSNNNQKQSLEPKLIVNEVLAGCTLINFCSDYTDETDCNNDKCIVARNSVAGITCGNVYNPLTRCMDTTNCGCIWNSASGTCNSYWDTTSLCGTCGNGVEDYGEQCDDGNQNNGDGCSYPGCQFENNINPPCPYGTTLCSDGTCSKNCYYTDTEVTNCNNNGACEEGEGCTCLDCYGNVDTCAEGLICNIFNAACCNGASDGRCDLECSNVDPDCGPAVCGNGYREIGEECDDGNTVSGDGCASDCKLEILSTCCVEGTAECEDNTCSLNCYVTDNSIVQNGDNCCSGLTFSIVDQACCNTVSDGYCNPYCHYVDPDCFTNPSGDEKDGICTTMDSTTDTCDDGILARYLNAIWIWAEGNNYPTNPTEDYWWDAECNGGVGCYRYDPIIEPVLGVRKHETCVDLNDEISCPEQIKINLFGIYSLLAAIVLIIIIYLIFFSHKKKKSKIKRKK
jgi:cysteine-rich repeat protein